LPARLLNLRARPASAQKSACQGEEKSGEKGAALSDWLAGQQKRWAPGLKTPCLSISGQKLDFSRLWKPRTVPGPDLALRRRGPFDQRSRLGRGVVNLHLQQSGIGFFNAMPVLSGGLDRVVVCDLK